MERLLIFRDGNMFSAMDIAEASEIVIGRDAASGLVLDDASVSRKHATLSRVNDQLFVEDHNSTNGTYLNRRRILTHILRHGDVLNMGHFEIRYFLYEDERTNPPEVEEVEEAPEAVTLVVAVPPPPPAEPEPVDITAPKPTPAAAAAAASTPETEAPVQRKFAARNAYLLFIRGPYVGQQKKIEGSLFTLGQPGGDVAVIARRPQGYFLLHIGGNTYPRINGQPITSTRGVQLTEGDTVEVGEISAEIHFG